MSTVKAGIILAAVGILSLAVLAPAATKTAGAGGDYTTIKAAHDDLAEWGDGTDVIEVLSGVHTVSVASAGTWINFNPKDSGSLTIRPQGDFHPVLALTAGTAAPDLPPEFVFLVGNASSGTLTVEGLTFIGADGTDAYDYGFRSVFRVLAKDAGREVTLVVRDCVVTHNKGANAPEFDFTQSHAGGTGNVNQFLKNEDAVDATAVLDVSIEDSILAYCRSNDGFIYMAGNGTSADTERLTLRHTAVMVINTWDVGLRWDNMTAASRFLSEDSVWLAPYVPLWLRPASAGAPAITLRRSIVVPGGPSGMAIYMETSSFAGTLSLQDVTLARTSGVDHVLVHLEGVEGAGSFAFTNVIAHPAASIYRNNNLTNVASIVVNGASVSPGRTAYYTGGGNVQAAFDGHYLQADPQYVDTDVLGALSGGTVRRWDSRANTAYDVLNRDFATAGSGGGRLTGGAQLGFALGTMITIK